ncbi:hypothetical protein ACE38W_14705 [Chitinophaga sp. Hz27]|uniref:hypothetical protein n=1 Tax=Chitinophaga sp. Hz27 TaxID=3347169 RepID=UPI0035DBC277
MKEILLQHTEEKFSDHAGSHGIYAYDKVKDVDIDAAAKEISQMFCDWVVEREYAHVSGMVDCQSFKHDVQTYINDWSNGTGFTPEQIQQALDKFKKK